MAENLVRVRFWLAWPNLLLKKKFSWVLPLPKIRHFPSYHGHLKSCTTSEETNDPILRKLSDGRTDG